MSMNRREFLNVLAVAAAGGMGLHSGFASAEKAAGKLYDAPRFGNVSLLHITDCHAQLQPIYFREPNVNLGFGDQLGKVPHLVGESLLKHFGIPARSPMAAASAPGTRSRCTCFAGWRFPFRSAPRWTCRPNGTYRCPGGPGCR